MYRQRDSGVVKNCNVPAGASSAPPSTAASRSKIGDWSVPKFSI